MIREQQQFMMSKYSGLYGILIPEKHFLRQLNELVDFSFVYDELLTNYSLTTGRGAKDPILMFKYLLLKVIHELSDVDVVSRSLSDMSFKYFLNLAPEDTELIDPGSLTKFRKLRLKNVEMSDLLISKTVQIAIEHGVLKSKTLIVDATHTKAKYNKKSTCEVLLERAKLLRKEVYKVKDGYKEKFP
jgi:transposase